MSISLIDYEGNLIAYIDSNEREVKESINQIKYSFKEKFYIEKLNLKIEDFFEKRKKIKFMEIETIQVEP